MTPHIFLVKGNNSWKWVVSYGNNEAEAEINALLTFNKGDDMAVSIYGRENLKCIN